MDITHDDTFKENTTVGGRLSFATESEKLFHGFCEESGWPVERLDETGDGVPSPDFRISLADGSPMIVEIKQFDPNSDERAALRALEKGDVATYDTEPGKRLRSVIRKANRQIRARSAGSLPGMLVVYNATGCWMHTDQYAILTAMRGLDVLPLVKKSSPNVQYEWGRRRPGPKKQMTNATNTATSAVAVLVEEDGALVLDVYHNQFARRPINPRLLVGRRVRHWKMRDDEMDWRRS